MIDAMNDMAENVSQVFFGTFRMFDSIDRCSDRFSDTFPNSMVKYEFKIFFDRYRQKLQGFQQLVLFVKRS